MSSGYPETGEQVGPFVVGARLGVGGMGVVFSARDSALNRDVALKVIAPHLSNDPDFQARFVREARAQASLDSAHVVQVYSFGEADGRLYIASQLIPDGDLGQMLARHGVPPARIALDLIAQVADGLSDAHASGLVHRDIKPGNVLLRRRSGTLQAYLGDFGIARQVADRSLTQAGGTVGTPTYMAPELHVGGDAGPTTDLYSLGCLLWAGLSGSAPYAGGSDFEVMRAHLEAPVPQVAPTGPLAAEINRVLRTALAKTPTERYPSAAAMRDDLNRVARLPDDPQPIRVAGAAPGAPPPGTAAAQAWQPPGLRAPTPTPTPTPAPGPPPGPGYGGSRTAAYAGPHPGRAPAPTRGGGRWWVIIAVLAVVVVGAVVAVLLLAGGDDPTITGSAGGSSSSPSSPASPSSSGPTDASSSASGDDARAAAAVESLGTSLAEETGTSKAVGRCIAQDLVDTFGVDGLIDAGVLTEDLQLGTGDVQDQDSAIAQEIVNATFGCLGAS